MKSNLLLEEVILKAGLHPPDDEEISIRTLNGEAFSCESCVGGHDVERDILIKKEKS